MRATTERSPGAIDLRSMSMALVTTYPPTRCGIGRFSLSLTEAWKRVAPATRVDVARVVSMADPPSEPDGVHILFDPQSPIAIRKTARRLNEADAVVVQHEFGIYGPDDGIAVLELVEHLHRPTLAVLHTVLAEPSRRQREIVEGLAAAGTLVVPSHIARATLLSSHDIDPSIVHVIPHGSSWTPLGGQHEGPRRRLVSWGLLGPGKGIERSLHALALLSLDPPVSYRIIGQTHPNVLARQGQRYRQSLIRLARQLGIEEQVTFVDSYLPDDVLRGEVEAADIVVVPYDNHEQVCSGVLTDAIALGKPVVATRFPHAEEMLASGAGRCVDHTPEAIAQAARELLSDDGAYRAAVAAAETTGRQLQWDHVARSYLDVLRHIRSSAGVA